MKLNEIKKGMYIVDNRGNVEKVHASDGVEIVTSLDNYFVESGLSRLFSGDGNRDRIVGVIPDIMKHVIKIGEENES